jgi:hypothetical protein
MGRSAICGASLRELTMIGLGGWSGRAGIATFASGGALIPAGRGRKFGVGSEPRPWPPLVTTSSCA